MFATVRENVAFMTATLTDLKGTADAALFPECATTGFHRGLPAQVANVAAGLDTLRACVQATGVTALVGTPRAQGEQVLNALAVLEPGQPDRFVDKVGLTPSEARFFSPGASRAVHTVLGRQVTAVLCREVLDDVLVDADLVLWPGYIQWEGGPDDYLGRARATAQANGVTLVQANWPVSLNAPDTRGLGGSVVVGPDGAVRHRMALDHVGVRVVEV